MERPTTPKPTDPNRRGVTGRAVLIVTLLIPFNAYWVFNAEVVYATVHASVLSIFFNCVMALTLLVAANALLRRLWPRRALSSYELLVIYSLLAIATTMCSHDLTQILIPLLIHPFRFATPENGWERLFFRYLPAWLTVRDETALRGFYEGHANFFAPDIWPVWVRPLGLWLGFVLLLMLTLVCLNVLIRRRWSDEERLSFPVIHLPLQMTEPGGHLWRSRLFWAGLLLAGGLDVLHGLHGLFPVVPDWNTRSDLSRFVTTHPWRAIGWSPLCFYPFAVGLGYFMPKDLAFSCWFFYLVWKGQMVFRAWLGWEPLAGPYTSDQQAGAWIGLGLFALWNTRQHLAGTWRGWKIENRESKIENHREEPLSYPTAWVGFFLGLLGLGAFGRVAGLSGGVIAGFWGGYLLLVMAVARMRAELGPPTHDLYYGGPEWLMTSLCGVDALGPRNVSVLSLFYWITRDFRSHPMPHQLEAFRLAEYRHVPRHGGPKLVAALLYAAALGFVAAGVVFLVQYYEHGASARLQGYALGLSAEAYRRLEQWLRDPLGEPDFPALRQFGGGLAFTLLLMALRRRFLWIPFHPVGYAVAGSWTMSWLWFSIFLAWAIKSLLLRYGGLARFQRGMPFFLGLMVGEYVVGGAWTLIGMALGQKVYGFFV